MRPFSLLAATLLLTHFAPVLLAQPTAPLYEECRLDSIFPAGGQRGTNVKVEFKGYQSGLTAPREIIVDGPPGITVHNLRSINASTVEATLEIAPSAPLGRRWLRVVNERSGLTNFAYFLVSDLPERIEIEPNSESSKAEVIPLPVVINGRINPAADLDYYRFTGKQGQTIVAAIAAHALDIHGQNKSYGIADFSLELQDDTGKILAAAEDSVGFDPIIEQILPRDGEYLLRIQLLNYQGFPEAVYRLTVADVPYITSAFPPGFQRGKPTEIELSGPNIQQIPHTGRNEASGTNTQDCKSLNLPREKYSFKRIVGGTSIASPASILAELAAQKRLNEWSGESGLGWDPAFKLRHITIDEVGTPGLDVPLIQGELPESIEAEPNDHQAQASDLNLPITVNARFQNANDADWYRLRLNAQQKVQLEVVAHRFIRSPVDTLLQVYDAQGKLLQENDDVVFDPGYEQYHDFKTTDSKLHFVAPSTGEYFVKVSEQSGISTSRAVYRLTVDEDRPDFHLSHFPDAAPIWGPGSTACVLVRIDRFSGCNDDIEVTVEGLPASWSTRSATSLKTTPERPLIAYQLKVFVTITAPANAAVGTCLPFRIVGRSKRADGTILERHSQPLSLFFTSDTGFFRASPFSRVAVTKPQGPWLEPVTQQISITQHGTGTLTVKVNGAGDLKQMPIVVNLAGFGVACVLTTPQNLPIIDGQIEVPIKLPEDMFPGIYGITVAQTWRSDIRIGMPGPCTPLIPLTVTPAK